MSSALKGSQPREAVQLHPVDAAEHSPSGEPPPAPRSTALERVFLQRLLKTFAPDTIRIVLWDGTVLGTTSREQPFSVHIRSRKMLWRLLAAPEFCFPEGYAQGEIEIEGDLRELCCRLISVLNKHAGQGRFDGLLARLWRHRQSRHASRLNIAHHYDLGNDFYKLWLDEQLVYTCAYFADEQYSLEQAQIAKMDHVCRKLRLRPGERVIEAGCGWGAFALHMARHYGVRVRAFNISREQLAYARERARSEGLEQQVEFVEEDWRGISGSCDAFVSIGMLEHVGPKNYWELGRIVRSVLTPNGRGLIHSIGVNLPRPLNHWIEQRIFPGAEPPTLRQMMDIFEPNALTVLDVENLRLHYVQTLEHWLQRFEHALDTVRNMFDEKFIRTWRMYLVTSIAAFQTGGLQLYQALFAPMTSNAVPRTRAHLYAPPHPT